MAGFVFHSVKYVSHIVVFVSHSVKQRICLGVWKNLREREGKYGRAGEETGGSTEMSGRCQSVFSVG